MSYERLCAALTKQLIVISELLHKEQQFFENYAYDKWLLFWQATEMSSVMQELISTYQQLNQFSLDTDQEILKLFAEYHVHQQQYWKHEIIRNSILTTYSKLGIKIGIFEGKRHSY